MTSKYQTAFAVRKTQGKTGKLKTKAPVEPVNDELLLLRNNAFAAVLRLGVASLNAQYEELLELRLKVFRATARLPTP